tara:strand:- start:42398 stop:42769 length:372 start_codon:yes stop_codon:yes gene_type:complete
MRNILIAIAAVATLIFVGNAIAATPSTNDAPSILVESASNASSIGVTKPVAKAQTMVNTQIEPPVVLDEQSVEPQPQAVHQHHGHYHHTYHRSQPRKKQSVFDKLMDLERRKNAWLMKTFLGR